MSTSSFPGDVPVVKEKKTRKRQRVSCVECTKRRQKCDRQYPCALCVSRGISHLCRWESGPVARPAPARPPVIPTQDSQSELTATIRTLSERIATLERSIASQDVAILHHAPSVPPSYSSPTPTNVSSPDTHSAWSDHPEKIEKDSSPAPLERDVHEAAVTLARLSLAHHGEYVGGGSVVCALHELGDTVHMPIPYSKSTESTSTNTQFTHSEDPVCILAQNLPSRQHTDALLFTFFAKCDWHCGIPEKWFRTACSNMWRALDPWKPCTEKINANWLSLLFAVLALAPSDTASLPPGTQPVPQETLFMHAVSARRLAEDALIASPSFSAGQSAAEGTVLGCIAAVLMGGYLADRGRVSEAWKLLGGAIRTAQAAGMHRDPLWEMWEVMCEDERLLRRRGWWSLVIWDRLYSYVLGRPAMIQGKNFDVPLPSHQGSEDPYDAFQAEMVQLSEIVDEADQKCLCPEKPLYSTVIEVDRRYDEWVARLPPQFRWNASTRPVGPTLPGWGVSRQRHTIAVWYLACRMNLHRPWLMRVTPPILPTPFSSGSLNMSLNPSRERCISLAMELVRIQCAAPEHANPDDAFWASEDINFGRTFFLFDGAVNIMCALAFSPGSVHEKQGLALVDRAIDILSEAGKDQGKGEISRRGVTILNVLKQARERKTSDNDNIPMPHAEERSMDEHGTASHGNDISESTRESSFTSSQPPPSYSAQARQPNPSIPFRSPFNLLLSPNTSGLAVGSYATPSHTEGLTTQLPLPFFVGAGDQNGAVYAQSSTTLENGSLANPADGDYTGMSWGNDAGMPPNVQMMLPFEMLRGMPLNGNWRGSSM